MILLKNNSQKFVPIHRETLILVHIHFLPASGDQVMHERWHIMCLDKASVGICTRGCCINVL